MKILNLNIGKVIGEYLLFRLYSQHSKAFIQLVTPNTAQFIHRSPVGKLFMKRKMQLNSFRVDGCSLRSQQSRPFLVIPVPTNVNNYLLKKY